MATANHDGAKVITQDCTASTPAARHWIPVNGNSSTGQGPVTPIKIFGNKCLDVTDGKAKSGTKLQIWTCGKNNANQKWRINGDLTIAWAGKGFCLDLTDGNFANGTRVRYYIDSFVLSPITSLKPIVLAQIWTCNPNNINQHWHLIPPA